MDKVVYLGHVLSKDGVQVDCDKIRKVQEFPVPNSQKQLKSFLGLCNYYRRFVNGYANIVSPLISLLKIEKKGKFKDGDWTEKCQNAFEHLKKALISPPILGFPNMNKEFVLSTDASGTAIGYILGQVDKSGNENVIACGGRALSHAERKWSTTDQECLAVIEGIKCYNHYLLHQKFTVYTDHKALSYLLGLKDPTGRLGRWNIFLQQFDMEIIHRAGKSNGNADAISRIPYPETKSVNACDNPQNLKENESTYEHDKTEVENFTLTEVEFEYENVTQISSIDEIEDLPSNDIQTLQRECPDFDFIIKFLETREMPDDDRHQKICIRAEDQYVLNDNVLYHMFQPRSKGKVDLTDKYILQLAVPIPKRKEILLHYHDCIAGGGHFGISRTYEKIRRKYWWPKMYQEIKNYVRSCPICQTVNTDRQSRVPPLQPLPVEDSFSRVHIDILGPLPKSKQGHQYILLIVDSFSKWSEAFPLISMEAKEIAEILVKEYFSRYGAPIILVSDRGRNFMSKLVSAIC